MQINQSKKTAQEANTIRAERDRRLSDCDWRFYSDVPFEQEWKDYRQALRNVPQQAGFPESIAWPDIPTGGQA